MERVDGGLKIDFLMELAKLYKKNIILLCYVSVEYTIPNCQIGQLRPEFRTACTKIEIGWRANITK